MNTGQSRLALLRRTLLLLGCVATTQLNADERIIVDAKLNDQPLKLAVDTGASDIVIFRSATDQRGIKLVSPPADVRLDPGQVVVSRTEPVKFEIMGQMNPNARLAVLSHPPYLSLDIDGVVGWANIRNNVWLLSGAQLTLRLLKSIPPEAAGWINMREIKGQRQLYLELPQTNLGAPVYVGIDTGAQFGLRLSTEEWTKWREQHPHQPVTLEAYYMPGIDLVIGEHAWADEINLAGLVIRGVPITCVNSFEKKNHPPGTMAVLGLSALKRVDMVFDGINGVTYAQPLDTSPMPYEHNRLGAIFVPADPKTTNDLVAHVAKNSPAEKAGVENGDVLLKIDQLDVTPWRTKPGIQPLRRFWVQAPGTKLLLTIRRGEKTITAEVVLRNILGPQANPTVIIK